VLDVGTRGMQSVLDAVATHGIHTLMLASSSEVYQTPPVIPTSEDVPLSIPDPFNPRYSYAAVKIISEMQALYNCSASRILIIRPHNIYGPDMGNEHVIPQMADRIMKYGQLEFSGEAPISGSAWLGPRPFWGGGETRAFCYIDDAVEQIMLVRKRGLDHTIYNIGSDEETAIYALAAKIAAAAGKPLKVVEGTSAKGGAIRRCPDMTRTYALGAIPACGLDLGLTETLCWYWRHP
jgi:nucleoside-diphosphate-sugar epimerase